MNILELDTYNLADAVKFNDQLNPRLWGKDRNLKPDVREHLLQIADDFREFLGVSGYELKDITLSGSNAAYTYTPNSDIDLHLVVDLPQADANEVYRELFDAKKFQYNEQHNISIGGYPVELYVQDANKKHISQGIYSVLNNTWIDIPKRKDTGVDDISTRSKYEDLATRIDTAVKSNDYDSMANLMEKIKTMRQTGLDEHGEFGPENLAFKMLRNQGSIKKLVDARNAAKDRELSLKEREKVKPRVTYGFNTEDATATWDGVSATTQMFLNEKPEPSVSEIVSSFIEYCIEQLSIEQTPIVKFKKDPQWSARNKTFGRYNADQNLLEVSLADRHVMDILRTVAHELTHTRQHEVEDVPDDAGATGSQWENEANAQAGVLMREYAQKHPEFFEAGEVAEGVTSDMRDFFAHGQPDPKLFKSVKPVATVPAENGPADMQKILAKIKNKTPISKDEFAKLKRYRFQQGIAEGSLNEGLAHPVIVVDVQPEYSGMNDGDESFVFPQIINFVNKQTGPVLMFVNAEDQGLSGDTIQDIKQYWDDTICPEEERYTHDEETDDYIENPNCPKINWQRFAIADKGYGYFRSWMDHGIEPATIVATIRELYQQKKSDSRELQFPAFNKRTPQQSLIMGAMQEMEDDPISVNWTSVSQLKRFNGAYIVGGARDQCLREVELLMNAFNIKYKRIDSLIYEGQQGIAEAKIEEVFDQPYKTKSEKSDYGDVDMLAKLPDGTNLSIMFNREDAKNDVWGVEFYRNNSQEVTGEGDAQRIFATVLTAIQKFIKKKSPQKLFFSASKETDPTIYYEPDEPQPNPASRAKLYDRLVQRYAKELGYRAFRSDTGTLVRYELSRLQPAVAESSGYIPTKKQAKDPRFVMALTKDVKPGATGKEANKLNLQTDSQGHPGLLMTGLANALREFKETGKLPAKLEEEIIDEINMSPSNLAQLTSSSNARAGMEFEMYFPDAAQSNDDYPSEPDYDADENVNRFSDIEEFFRGDYNSRGDVARAIQDLQEEFFEWTEGQISSRFEDDAPSIVYQWVINNVDDDTIIEKMDANEEQYTDDPEYKKKIQQDYADFLLKENDYSDAYDVYSDDERDSIDEGDWFVDNYLSMSDVASETGLTWPYWSDDNGGGTMGLDNIAESFREAIGRPVKASSNYHSTTRDSTSYIIEPDGSLDSPNDSSDGGLEFISPPLPLEEMISDLNKVTKWAVYNNCYTNESTGLHINVSVPGFTREKLDYVKLALLLGDEYVLKEFNREGNYYAKSSMQSIRERVAENPKKAQELLDTMKTNLDGLASKAIHNGDTNKYVSINTKDGYIEFRSPGNDWLGEMAADGTKIENTLRRFVVALSAAIDPTAYREEYLKKLYKLLAPKGTGIDTMMYFAKFVAGELPQGALKSFVRQAQLERKTKKGGDGSEYTAIPSSGTQKYEIQRISDDEIVTAFNAESSADANSIARVWLSDNMLLRVDFRLLRATGQEQAELRQQAQSDTGNIKYDLYNTTTAQVYRTFYAANDGMALDIKRRYREELRAEDPDVRVGVRRSVASAPTAQSIGFASAPTAQSTGGEFSGQWIIKDGQGRELHRFGGIGTNQSDANRIAAGWLGNNMPDLAGQEIEVVPELLEEGWKDTLGSLAIAGAIGAGGAGGMAAKNAVSGTPTTAPAQTAQVAQGTVKKAPATLKAAPKAAPKAVTPKRVQVQATTQLAGEKLLLKTAIANGISGTELAAFMAQCAHESADFKRMKEYGGSLDFRKYDPKYAPKKAKTLGNKKVGDGAKYKGRGFIQITGRYNYTKAGQELNLPLATHPELVERPDIAAKVAVWFWQHRVQPNVTNFSNVADVTKMINPAMRGLEDRKDNFNDYMQTTVASL